MNRLKGQDFYAIWNCAKQQYNVYRNNGSFVITVFRFREVKNYI